MCVVCGVCVCVCVCVCDMMCVWCGVHVGSLSLACEWCKGGCVFKLGSILENILVHHDLAISFWKNHSFLTRTEVIPEKRAGFLKIIPELFSGTKSLEGKSTN